MGLSPTHTPSVSTNVRKITRKTWCGARRYVVVISGSKAIRGALFKKALCFADRPDYRLFSSKGSTMFRVIATFSKSIDVKTFFNVFLIFGSRFLTILNVFFIFQTFFLF